MCTQTIFMEMVFRRIEFWIDGDRGAQMRLAKQAWNGEKIRKRLLKWAIFFLISFFIANIFLAYLIGSDQLIQYITEGPSAHMGTLVALLISAKPELAGQVEEIESIIAQHRGS